MVYVILNKFDIDEIHRLRWQCITMGHEQTIKSKSDIPAKFSIAYHHHIMVIS